MLTLASRWYSIDSLLHSVAFPVGNPGGIPARLTAGSKNLGGILPGTLPRFSPGGNIPCGENFWRGDLWGILPRFYPGRKMSGSQNLGAVLPGISPRFAAGSKILGEIHCRNSGKMFVTGNFFPLKIHAAKILKPSCFKLIRYKLHSAYVIESSKNTDKLLKNIHI